MVLHFLFMASGISGAHWGFWKGCPVSSAPAPWPFCSRDAPFLELSGPSHLRSFYQDHIPSPSLGGWKTTSKHIVFACFFSQNLSHWTVFKVMADTFTHLTHAWSCLLPSKNVLAVDGHRANLAAHPSSVFSDHIYLTQVILELRWLFSGEHKAYWGTFVTTMCSCDWLLLIMVLIPPET